MSEHSWYLAGAVIILALLVTFLATVAAPAAATPGHAYPSDPEAGQSSARWHQVAEGESLRSIAHHYYGSGRHWRTLQIANDADHLLAPGTMLLIPGMREELDRMTPAVSAGERPGERLSHAAEDP